MSHEGLTIKKGGKLIKSSWDSDIGEYVTQDVTTKAGYYLFDRCILDSDVTLRDVFLLIKSNMDIMKVVLNNWVEEIVDEGLNRIPTISQHSRDIEYLELYWVLSKERTHVEFKNGPIPAEPGSILHQLGDGMVHGSFSGPKKVQGILHPDFHGVSAVLKEDDDFAKEGWKVGERVPMGVSLTPACDLMHIPLKLNEQFCICDDIVNDDFSPDNTEVYDGCEYSLGHILYTIIWELTWHGAPDSRDDISKDLKEAIDDIKSKDKEDEQ